MLNIIAGQDSRDPRCVAPVNAPDFVDAVSRAGTMDEWRVGYLADLGFVDLERDVARVCEGTLETLTQYGCSMETVEAHFADIVDAYWLLNSYRRSGVLDQYRDEWTEYMDPSLVWRIERGEAASARDVALAEMAQTTAYHRLRAMFEKYDLLITPTVSVVAPMVAEGDDVTSTSSIAWGGLAGLALTYLFNLSGHPALTIPAGLSPEGLPIGLQLIGGPFDELSVLRFAGLCEQVLDWPRLSPAAILG
jgi:Asp-tRNA(Asn)/Glu-tRNA(Gln) amidotransferase A subunit family amidase